MRSLLAVEEQVVESLGPVPLQIGPDALRRAFGLYPTGVAALCRQEGEDQIGMVVSTFSPVSLDPPLVSVCLQLTSTTWPRLASPGNRIGLSLLSNRQEREGGQLARKGGGNFDGVNTTSTPSGALFLLDAMAWFECSVSGSVEAGDHTIAVLSVHEMAVDLSAEPLVFHGSRFRRLGLV